jgi:uroporphyrinogen-III synthase
MVSAAQTPGGPGMRVIVTRPAAQGQAFVQRLQALGVDAVGLPLIGIAPPADPEAVRRAWTALGERTLVMFVSANAVAHFFDLRPPGAIWPPGTRAGATGPGTTAALRQAGVDADHIVEPGPEGPFDTDTLWLTIGRWPWVGRRVLVVRGESGRDWLAERLQEAGAEVDFVAAYRRVAPSFEGVAGTVLAAALAAPQDHCWHFSSSEAIAHLVADHPGADWAAARALATHPRIAATARRLGFGRVDEVGVRPEDVAAAIAPRSSDLQG